MFTENKKCFILKTGNSLNFDQIFMENLKKQTAVLQEVKNVDQCDFITVFCPVVSRTRTDIEAALEKLQDTSGN